MKFFSKDKVNEETVGILIKENKRLKKELAKKTDALMEVQRYKDEYKTLIEETNKLRNEYLNKLNEFDEIEKECIKQLNKIIE